jgi:hypothetical protein
MICARDTCNNKFEAKTHNMKYCSDECCRVATNEKLKEAYYEKKARLAGKKRICKTPKCGSILSRYNEGKVCNKCIAAEESAKTLELVNMVKRVSS